MDGQCGIKATSPTPCTGDVVSIAPVMSSRTPCRTPASSVTGQIRDNSSERVHTAFAVGGLGMLGR
jgi:hypothetical protein